MKLILNVCVYICNTWDHGNYKSNKKHQLALAIDYELPMNKLTNEISVSYANYAKLANVHPKNIHKMLIINKHGYVCSLQSTVGEFFKDEEKIECAAIIESQPKRKAAELEGPRKKPRLHASSRLEPSSQLNIPDSQESSSDAEFFSHGKLQITEKIEEFEAQISNLKTQKPHENGSKESGNQQVIDELEETPIIENSDSLKLLTDAAFSSDSESHKTPKLEGQDDKDSDVIEISPLKDLEHEEYLDKNKEKQDAESSSDEDESFDKKQDVEPVKEDSPTELSSSSETSEDEFHQVTTFQNPIADNKNTHVAGISRMNNNSPPQSQDISLEMSQHPGKLQHNLKNEPSSSATDKPLVGKLSTVSAVPSKIRRIPVRSQSYTKLTDITISTNKPSAKSDLATQNDGADSVDSTSSEESASSSSSGDDDKVVLAGRKQRKRRSLLAGLAKELKTPKNKQKFGKVEPQSLPAKKSM